MSDWVVYRASCLACGHNLTAMVGQGPGHLAARIGLPCTQCEARLVIAWEQRLESEVPSAQVPPR